MKLANQNHSIVIKGKIALRVRVHVCVCVSVCHVFILHYSALLEQLIILLNFDSNVEVT